MKKDIVELGMDAVFYRFVWGMVVIGVCAVSIGICILLALFVW